MSPIQEQPFTFKNLPRPPPKHHHQKDSFASHVLKSRAGTEICSTLRMQMVDKFTSNK